MIGRDEEEDGEEGKEGILLTSAHSHHVWLWLDEELIRVHGQLSFARFVVRGLDARGNRV